MFERFELQKIREKAKDCSIVPQQNENWNRAYLVLADAANCLDAMIARTEIRR